MHPAYQLDDDPRALSSEERAAWHRAQEADERAWLDDHARMHLVRGRTYETAA
ncbi:hypothetical protein [Streptomyces sp. Da 82-17]|uniref:hypothetical protein n=1 Tax=Streptomyces sp. Da 82-17 TaxID=3377116 RepID=UPI0038D3AB99